MGIYGFVCAGGGSIGVLLGGFLTSALNWHWIFLVNLPIGVAVYALSLALLPGGRGEAEAGRLDVAGALTATTSLMLAVYAIVNGNEAGWTSAQSIGLLAAAGVLLTLFLGIEARVRTPLMPLGLSAKLVMRFGIRPPLTAGLLLAAVGLVLFARAPADGNFAIDVLPGMLLLGLGAGVAFNPVLLAAMSDVHPGESGLASGVVNTSFMMGGALGLAVLASLAAARTHNLLASGAGSLVALNGGCHAAFVVGAVFAGAAALLSAVLLGAKLQAPARATEAAVARS